MKRRLGRLAVLCAAAVTMTLGMTTAPALAQQVVFTDVYGVSGAFLGQGMWAGPLRGEVPHNGLMTVWDEECDGDNGIIAGLYRWTAGDWSRVNLVSIRGCGRTNTISIKSPAEGGPRNGDDLRFRVCKLLPDGTWKDCLDTFTTQSY